ncbi:hypothetical protein BRARA_K01013 [Brassica rapa]|uniref:F-box domain-containing protein n=1 Tax=Brassica campestris TaxID=3711 RepID=A0A397KYU5_BRACM|nr:hypothetical protein BRARA_K01013 [Brassica rapa]
MMNNPCEVEPLSRRKKLKVCPPSGLSLLPEEMVLSCLARISKSEHDSLSLVSKWHRSLLLTPELHNFRTLSGCTEEKLKHPSRTKSTLPPEASCMVAHGCGIYIMGGRVGGRASSSSVMFLDCRSHTWITLPSHIRVWRSSLNVRKDCDKGGEGDACNDWHRTMFILHSKGWHVIENVVYCSNSDGLVTWCEAHKWESPETEVVAWREIQELDQVLPGHKLSNSGPNLLIFWDVLVPPHKLEIWCAEISLVRRKETCEIRGNIVWSQVVITLDPPPHHHHCRILSALPLNL